MALLYSFILGCFLRGGCVNYDAPFPEYRKVNECWYTELLFGAEYKALFVEGVARVDMWRTGKILGLGWNPNQLTSMLRAGVRLSMIEVAAEYSCYHSIISGTAYYNGEYELVPNSEGCYFTAYIKIGKD